jgi:hypothetical protein
MAADYITVNRSKQLGNSLVRAADLMRELRELVDKLKDAGNHSFDGPDYSVMEANFGLAAGQGANTLALINIVDSIINGSTGAGGATQQSQIEEFVARLAGQ